MFAKLTSLVGGGVTLPFDLGAPHSSAWGQWQHFNGTLRADGSAVSVFRISAMSKEDPKLRAARNGLKRLRMLRHPNILHFKETVETEEKGEQVIYVVTEAVSPLSETLPTLGLDGPQKEQYLAMGLHQVISALSFMNNDCKLIHGNVCSAAVVVTEGLDWRLHGFDLVTEHNWQEQYGVEVPLMAASWMVAAQYKPGEVGKHAWEAVKEGPVWAVDAWGLGCLIQEVYSGSLLFRVEDLRSTDRLPQSLVQYYQKLLASAAPRRLNPAKILEAGVLKSKLGDIMAFLENLALKDALEKDQFFKRLPSMLPSIPEAVAQRKLLPLLASALEYGGAPPVALGTLLSIGEKMPEEERTKQVIPILTKLFASSDRGIRRGLLENISSFGQLLPASLVEEQIYNNVQTGFNDANPYLRELTLKSMVVLGPKLSQKTLNQSVLKHLAKLQVDDEPAIRANTTVLLGNLAPQLSDATCKKVLLNAFTRALKDPFPPARAAGLRAVLATAKYHSPDDVAARVVPMVGPLCVDPVQEVRVSGLQCLEHFLGTLQTHSKELDKKAAEAASDSGATGIGSSGGAAAGGSSLLTGFGWAVSSLVSKAGPSEPSGGAAVPSPAPTGFGSSSTAPPAAKPPAQQGWDNDDDDFEPITSSSNGSRPRSAAALSPRAARPPSAARKVTSPIKKVEVDTAASGDGWSDDDPLEDMMDSMAAEKEARAKLSRLGVSNKPAAVGRTVSGGAAAGARPTSAGAGGAARTTAGAGARRVGAGTGGGMKLGVKKLVKEDADEFSDW